MKRVRTHAGRAPVGSWRRRFARFAGAAALAAGLALGGAASAHALPANPAPLNLNQPDGTPVEIGVRGDEDFHFNLNADGAVVLQDAGGVWRQVVTERGSLALGARAEEAAQPGSITAADLANEGARQALYALSGKVYRGDRMDRGDGAVTLDSIRDANRRLEEASGFRSVGNSQATLPLLLIVVGFNDQAYSTTYDWARTFFTSDYGISTLYEISSNGKFTWAPAMERSEHGVDGNTSPSDAANDGILHITLNRPYGNLDTSTPDGFANYVATMGQIIDEASRYTDFASYDANGNGAIEPNELGLGIVFAGYEAATGYVPTGQNSMWSHQWSFTEATGSPHSIDLGAGSSVTIDKYIVQSETEAHSSTHMVQSGIGALGHELGHFLGLPDLYDTADGTGPYSEYYTGYLSLMDGGSWGRTRSGEDRPTFFDPYSRYFLGYIDPVEITSDGTYTATSQMSADGYSSHIIRVNADEYYLIENRQYESFDEGMATDLWRGTVASNAPAGAPANGYAYDNPTGGVVVWHIDNGIATRYGLDGNPSNTVNVKTHRPGVMPAYPELENVGNKRPLLKMPFLNAGSARQLGTATAPVLAYDGSDDPAARVDTGIRISSSDEGAESMTFTVDFPGTLSNGTVNGSGHAVLESDGGEVELAVTGANLNAGDVVTAQVTDDATGEALPPVTLAAAGTDRSADAAGTYTGTIALPGNTGDEARTYSVAFALNGRAAEGAASVTVKAPARPDQQPDNPDPGQPGNGDQGQGQGQNDNQGQGQGTPRQPNAKTAKGTSGRRLPKTADASLAFAAGAAVSGIAAIAVARSRRPRTR